MNQTPQAQALADYAQRAAAQAQLAAESVMYQFAHRALGVPKTLIGAVQVPDPRPFAQRIKDWHYWWQAHFLECMVDAGERELWDGNRVGAVDWSARTRALLRGINVRNMGTFVNQFFDDMAWLALAAGRMNDFARALGGDGDAGAQDAGNALFPQLRSGMSPTGGMSWSKQKREFINTPATAPAAIAFARAGAVSEAAALVEWLNNTLWDAERSLYFDGVNVHTGKVRDVVGGHELNLDVEKNIYTYNQGVALAALLAVAAHDQQAAPALVRRAEQLIVGIVTHLSEEFEFADGQPGRVLASGGEGDGALFTGILARYLAVAARCELLSEDARLLAASLVHGSARAVWEGRREFDPDLPLNEPGINPNEIRERTVAVFSPKFTEQAHTALVPGAPVELSGQVQAWMVFEAAALLARAS